MRQRIQIPRNGIELAGVLFAPENFDETKQYPAIVVVHPGGDVKEQTAGLYAGKLAETDFVAVAYDASHQGESGGELCSAYIGRNSGRTICLRPRSPCLLPHTARHVPDSRKQIAGAQFS